MRLRFVCLLAAAPPAVLAVGAIAPGCGGNEFEVAADGGTSGPSDGGGLTDTASPADGGASDGSHAGDSGPSTGDSGTDAGTSWCAGQTALFCEDFDEYPAGDAGVSSLIGGSTWSSFEQTGGTFGFDTSNPPSPPNALVAGGGNDAQVLIVKGFLAPGPLITTMHLEFDLRINAAGSWTVGLTPSAAGIAAISFGTTLEDGYVALAIAPASGSASGSALAAVSELPGDGGIASVGGFTTKTAAGTFPTLGQWVGRYAIEIDYSGSGTSKSGTVQIYQGVTPLLSTPMTLPSQFVNPKALAIAIGDYAGGGSTGSIDVEFDNVTFTEK